MFKLQNILIFILISHFHCLNVFGNDNRSISINNWMSSIHDNVLLSELTIPGTHDSAADHGIAWIQCQNLSIREQLEIGVRALDIRCRHINNKFTIHHDSFFLGKYFDVDIRDVCINFLKENPSETIVMIIKEEYTAVNNTEHFSQTIRKYIDGFEDYFFLTESIPTLGQARGKIVLLRRFDSVEIPMGSKINIENNTTSTSLTSIKTAIQDNYKIKSIFSVKEKWMHIQTHLENAKKDDKKILYINFLSGTGICPPKRVAKRVLKRLNKYLAVNPQNNRYGILFMDYINSKSVDVILNH